jgi:hypothetical protein
VFVLLNADGINKAVAIELRLGMSATLTFPYLRGWAKTIREISEKVKYKLSG